MPDGQPNRTHPTHYLLAHTLRVCAACAATAVVASLAACSAPGTPHAHEAQSPSARAGAPARGPAAHPREHLRATLARALRPVLPDGDTRLAVAVLDLDSAYQRITSYGEEATFDTASISKVNILATLLLQAQDEGRELTSTERTYAEEMIRTSDNAAANALWRAIGKDEGLHAANERLGLSSTRSGPGISWGLTQTTATDQVKLLRAVFADGRWAPSPPRGLTQASRAAIGHLMDGIADDQDWGVSAARSPGSRWALKNGWLRRNTTDLWVINSVGQVRVHGHRYLVSVLSDGNPTMESGISLVERAARAAIGAASTHARPWPQ
ncbi:serine hydrolase [Streptomyces sp. NBC_00443]|uniref:serine hydrolase n=1 Tax=Streptomyces sp. NBC_00443 TaxID=2975743 RepID=UPI002E1E2C7A